MHRHSDRVVAAQPAPDNDDEPGPDPIGTGSARVTELCEPERLEVSVVLPRRRLEYRSDRLWRALARSLATPRS